VRTLFLGRLEEESLNYASIYSHSLVKSREAYSVINELLEDRLITATATTALFSDQMDDAALQTLANSLSVNEIHLYNPQGVIEYSTTPAYLGWAAEPGHPVHNFMISGAHSLVEDIRRDSESDRYYKYAYVRLDDGRFVQLALMPISFRAFCPPLSCRGLWAKLAVFIWWTTSAFLGPDFTVLASSTPDHVGLHLDDTDLRKRCWPAQLLPN